MSSTSPFIWDRPRFIDRFRNLPAAPINHLQMATGEVCELADADLVQRALGGKRDAFEAIYCRYQAIVYRFARSMTGSVAMAEDVTQEVFVTLIRDLVRYEPRRAALSTYLYGVARNIARTRLRREQRFLNIEAVVSRRFEPAGRDDPAQRWRDQRN
jgi:DNA-directed RNA polymerase specialized sigma24 family protein